MSMLAGMPAQAGNDHYDVLVIGSGPGGATTAARVAETGKRVLILERGDFLPRERDNWSSRAVFGDAKYTADETFYDLRDRPFRPELHYYVGGNSKVYGAALFRLLPTDFGEVQHPDGVAPAWPLSYQDMEPCYVRAEHLFWVHGKHGEDPFAGVSSKDYEYPPVQHEPRIQQLSDGLEKLGLHPFHLPLGVRLTQDAHGRATTDSRCIRCDRVDGFPCLVGAKADAEWAVVRPALAAHPNLALMTRTTVERLLTDTGGRSVTGVAVTLPDGSPHVFTADIVVLSAGAILSAALLLRSANDKHPQGLANSSDLVGRNYLRHNNLALIAFSREPNPTVFAKTLALNDFYGPSEHWQYPMGHIQMLGKSDDWQIKGAAPRGLGWAPSAPYGEVAKHSIDFWLTGEDIPLAGSRVTLRPDGTIRLALAPAGAATCTARRYAGNTLVLETDWVTAAGAVRVIDFMPPRAGTPHLIRIAVGLDGEVAMRSVLRLRFDYGRVVPWIRNLGTQVHAIAGPDRVRLMSAVPLRGENWDTLADFTVRKGDRVPFVLSWAPGHDPQMPYVDAEQALSTTKEFWTEWSGHAAYQTGPYRDAVDRSLITLKALTYEPTGGIVAAATTSLPEEIGGVRNWDYRYCWLRDATYTLQALLAAGYRREAGAWRDWLLRSIAGQPETLQILYSLDGARRLPEAELPWLSGYQGSRPVRTGNAASGQLQLDVWGETLDALFLARQAGLPADPDAWALQVALMEYLESAWHEPDNGLWEVRGDRQHFTYSKVMAWAAADRMARSVRTHGLPGPVLRWEQLRDRIHNDVVTHAFDAGRNTFTQAYGSTALDASLLLIPRVGFLPATDSRVLGTIAAVRRELSDGGLIKRYQTTQTDDGLKGSEGLFIACSFWLVDALQASGQQRDAIGLFERLLGLRNDVGLLSEEWDPGAQRQLGNTPQAFSHFALVISALQLHMGSGARSDNPMSL